VRRLLGVLLAALAVFLAAPTASAEVIDGERAKNFVERITSFGQRPAGGLHERQVANLLARGLANLGYTIERQTFLLPDGRYSQNVVARTPGTVRVVVLAHMDGVYNTVAANDNGSGVAGLVEIARVLRGYDGLLLATVGAEERVVTGSPHHLGSRALVRSMTSAEREAIRFVVSLDMISVGSVLNVRGLESSPNRSARWLLQVARDLGYRASYLQDSGMSDHTEFTRAGVPAAWLEWRWDTCWHQPCDTARRVDPVKLRRAARLALVTGRSVLRKF
jgi:Peptidase family M28